MAHAIVLSSSLQLGQLTFLLRVAIQILYYGGITIISLILVAHAPRVTTIETHDVINRLVGSATMTWTTFQWLVGCAKTPRRSTLPAAHVIFVICLAISYTAFVALSDIGLLGLKACQVDGKTRYLRPASVQTIEDAQRLVTSNMVGGVDPANIGAHRCDSDQGPPFQCLGPPKNSTFADADFWKGINSTDTDALMPRRIRCIDNRTVHPDNVQCSPKDAIYQFGPSSSRLKDAMVKDGLALSPTQNGVLVVVGVPNLAPHEEVNLENAMAVEIDFGCMSTGLFSTDYGAQAFPEDFFRTDAAWMEFSGPNYMRKPLLSSVGKLRDYLVGSFNETPVILPAEYEGLKMSPDDLFNQTAYPDVAHVRSWVFPDSGQVSDSFLEGCSQGIGNQLGIHEEKISPQAGSLCGFMAVGGPFEGGGERIGKFSRMLCGTSTQINLVSSIISVDSTGRVSVNISRVPSGLSYTSFQDPQPFYDTYGRFTLSPAPPGSDTQHFIPPGGRSDLNTGIFLGLGSIGSLIPRIGNAVFDPTGQFMTNTIYSGTSLLDNSGDTFELTPQVVTRWAGEVAGSFFIESISYNGWVALDSPFIVVRSNGGESGICYEPVYALGFLPLLLSAIVVVVWAIVMLFKSTFGPADSFKASYGGLGPYTSAVCPEATNRDTLLVWENTPQPSLQVLPEGAPVLGDVRGSALKVIRSGSPYTTYEFNRLSAYE